MIKTKVKIEIKSFWGTVLFESERSTIKEALQDAVLQDADLRGADLQDAVLQGAVLQGAVLQGAVLQGADLRGAVLQDADLRGADLQDAVLQGAVLQGAVLQGADLRGAVLQDADLRGAVLQGADLQDAVLQGADLRDASIKQLGDYVNQCSRDMLFIFEHLKSELPGLRKALVEGRINGTQYEGDCACLIGTLGKLDGGTAKVCRAIPFYEMGLQNYGEQWFYQIRTGDTPKNNEFAAHAVKLIDKVLKEDLKRK
jgi:hypothetical protein